MTGKRWFVVLIAALGFGLLSLHGFRGGYFLMKKNKAENKTTSCGLPLAPQKQLTSEQYHIVREGGTERPFQNAYWDNKRVGLYVDVVTGEPLFVSGDKFDSGTGWPSFTRPVGCDAVVEKPDMRGGMKRMEVRTKKSDLHLGHVFDDGPAPGGKRYCINSAALRFIPVEDLEKEGYGVTMKFFQKEAAAVAPREAGQREMAVFGAGCFWGIEAAFREVKGVVATAVGYMGGTLENPTYEDVSSGETGHAEVVRVTYDPSAVPYEELLRVFWNIHDPTTLNRQGPDIGTQYRSVIFTNSPEQEQAARRSREGLERSGKLPRPVVTEVAKAETFWRAEEYHQGYFEKKGVKSSCHLPSHKR